MAKPFLPVLSVVLLLAQGASALVYLDPATGDDANGAILYIRRMSYTIFDIFL